MNPGGFQDGELKRRLQEAASEIQSLKTERRELEGRLRDVCSTLKSAQENRSLRLGLLGVRGSAKSSLLAAWRLRNADAAWRPRKADADLGIWLTFKDDATIAYLKEVTDPILKTGITSPTGAGLPKPIVFQLSIGREQWDVETLDYTGEYVDLVTDPGEQPRAEKCRAFLKHCDVIVCCHYWDDRSQATLEAVNRVLDVYDSQFLFALTRLDEKYSRRELEQNVRGIFKRMANESVDFKNLCSHIEKNQERTGRVNAFPLCPLGKNFADLHNWPAGKKTLSAEDLSPLNIYRPFELAVQRRKKREEDVAAERSHLERALARVDASLRATKGELFDAIRKQLEAIKARVKLDASDPAMGARARLLAMGAESDPHKDVGRIARPRRTRSRGEQRPGLARFGEERTRTAREDRGVNGTV